MSDFLNSCLRIIKAVLYLKSVKRRCESFNKKWFLFDVRAWVQKWFSHPQQDKFQSSSKQIRDETFSSVFNSWLYVKESFVTLVQSSSNIVKLHFHVWHGICATGGNLSAWFDSNKALKLWFKKGFKYQLERLARSSWRMSEDAWSFFEEKFCCCLCSSINKNDGIKEMSVDLPLQHLFLTSLSKNACTSTSKLQIFKALWVWKRNWMILETTDWR